MVMTASVLAVVIVLLIIIIMIMLPVLVLLLLSFLLSFFSFSTTGNAVALSDVRFVGNPSLIGLWKCSQYLGTMPRRVP
jgi:hypothetical protein